jgi:hypothetical protein
MNGTYTAVVDRIVDGEWAVLLLEADGETVDQFDIDVEKLPPDGQHEGAVFDVSVADGALYGLEYRPWRERARRERAQERFDRLSEPLGEYQNDGNDDEPADSS